jgi:hypothetical protein
MAAVGEIIAAADYNTIRNKVANILGVGSASSGYGQTLNSETVNPLDPDVEKRKMFIENSLNALVKCRQG